MATANGGAAGANGDLAQVNGALMDGARVRGAGQAAAPVAGPLVAPVAVALFPPGLAHFDLDGALMEPLPRKGNGRYEILPKIAGATRA